MADRLIISPSQVSTYELCHRKWAWGYIEKIKGPPNKFAQLGLEVHDILEAWMRDGTAPDRETKAGAIAIPGLKHLPQPGTAVVEGKFLWALPEEPFDITGRIDWHDVIPGAVARDDTERRARIVELALMGELLRIGDHKTTGDFKWAMNPDQLRRDIQAVIYASYFMALAGVPAVLGRWVYYRTRRTPSSKCVDWDITREEAAPIMTRVRAVGHEMVIWKAKTQSALDVPFDAGGCRAYGGCFYEDHCNLTSRERLVSLMAQQSLKDKMAARAAAQQNTTTTTAPAPAVNPPESTQAPAPTPAPPPQQQGLSLKEKMAARTQAAGAPRVPGPPPPEPATTPPPAAGPAAPPAAPAAGMTLKEKMAARQAAGAGATTVAASSPRVAPVPPPQAGQVPANVAAVDMQGFAFLFVDCAPIKSDGLRTVPLSNLVAEAPNGDFAAYLDTNPLPEGVGITMSMATPEGKAAYEPLSARATHVVRGFG